MKSARSNVPARATPSVERPGERTLRAAEQSGADLVIIDTAGRTNDAASAAAKVADLILIALQPSLIDLKTMGATLDIIRLAGGLGTRLINGGESHHRNLV